MKELFLDHNIGFDEYITGNRFIDICDITGASFCKTDFLNEYADKKTKLLITHNSDYPIDEARFSYLSKKVDRWLAQNKSVDSKAIESLPIGLENMILRVSPSSRLGTHSSQIPNAIEKAKYIDHLSAQKINHDKLVYLNINPRTYRHEREYVINKFKDKEWSTYESGITWREYYDRIARHKFVFSPRGNGIDCHRTWEALYLRTIPIVKSSICMNDFSDLPILFINNWDEIGYDFLVEKYEEISSTKYDLSKLKISYWRKYIESLIDE